MQKANFSAYRCWFLIAACSFIFLLSGCSGLEPTETNAPVLEGTKLGGKVLGGQQPIAHSAIYLFAASTSGYGTAATNLLTQTVTTGDDGTFSTNAYTCTPGQQLYLVALGGNPGGGTNMNAANMAALGDCSSISSYTFINMNEITTVASVFALAQFMSSFSSVGTSQTNTVGLVNAFALVKNLTDLSTGSAAGSTLPSGAIAPSVKINTLADALAECINSTGGYAGDSGSSCGTLFTLTTPIGGIAPTNTVDAALNIARFPALNVSSIFNTVRLGSPFAPRLTKAPNDWTLSIGYTGGGLNYPAAVAIDSTGSVWAANEAGVATKLSPIGVPAAQSGFADNSLYESYGVAIDAQDSAWITNAESANNVNGGYGTITKLSSSGQVLSGTGFSAGGIFFPEAIAITPAGNVWVADYGDATATLLASDGTPLSGAAGYSSNALGYTDAVAVDGVGNGWFAANLGAAKVSASGAIVPYHCCQDIPSGIALDSSGNVWLSDYDTSSLLQFNSAGALQQQITAQGGLSNPQSLAIDGDGKIWSTNFQNDTISAFSAASSSGSNAISPTSGFGTDANLAQPAGLAIDSAGNLWIADSAANTLTQFIGLASPVKTPQLGLPTRP